jgi:hypothetical protein|tara:strand:- start:347 stop:655 length:309 start_codon:yes stop_codon:yes gene_type:complete
MKEVFKEIIGDIPSWMKNTALVTVGMIMGWLVSVSVPSLGENLKPDNIAEEIVEGLIEHHTGVDIDLTPDSPEMDAPFRTFKPKIITEYIDIHGNLVPIHGD